MRKAARERGIDLSAVLAAGYANPITLAALDRYAAAPAVSAEPVEAAATGTAAAPADGGVTVVPLSRTRQIIGKRLGESMREAPHFYVTGEFVYDEALARLKTLPGKIRINDLILYLTAQTLARLPALNATFHDGTLQQYQSVHLAVAVARDDGLITPVLRHAEHYSLVGMAEAGRALIERARANRLSLDDLQGGTFTVSNLGMIRQVDHFTAVINPPQVGILAVGALKPRPVAIDGGLFVRQTAHMTLSGDHRVVDGMDLAQFMAIFEEELNRFAPRNE
ncbi:MAG: 2-oxo acid dehydrogenase subunit E2 [Chloroflexi bacterium]|nr:2-oxo acid dehydrogenase subunit E2 [Chloroflexota bacterium]